MAVLGDGAAVGFRQAGLRLIPVSQTGFDLFTDRSVVAMRVDGELKDLAATVTGTETIEPITIDAPDGLFELGL